MVTQCSPLWGGVFIFFLSPTSRPRAFKAPAQDGDITPKARITSPPIYSFTMCLYDQHQGLCSILPAASPFLVLFILTSLCFTLNLVVFHLICPHFSPPLFPFASQLSFMINPHFNLCPLSSLLSSSLKNSVMVNKPPLIFSRQMYSFPPRFHALLNSTERTNPLFSKGFPFFIRYFAFSLFLPCSVQRTSCVYLFLPKINIIPTTRGLRHFTKASSGTVHNQIVNGVCLIYTGTLLNSFSVRFLSNRCIKKQNTALHSFSCKTKTLTLTHCKGFLTPLCQIYQSSTKSNFFPSLKTIKMSIIRPASISSQQQTVCLASQTHSEAINGSLFCLLLMHREAETESITLPILTISFSY